MENHDVAAMDDLLRYIQENWDVHGSFGSDLMLATNIEKMVGRENMQSVAFLTLLSAVKKMIWMNFGEILKLKFQSRIVETEMLAISPEQPEDVRAMAQRCLMRKLEMSKLL